MLHGQDLLALVVGDVQRRDGSIRAVIEVARARGMPPVRCALSKASTNALEKWITVSGKKRTDYLFPGRGVEGRHPMGPRQLSRLLKHWVAKAGLDPERVLDVIGKGAAQSWQMDNRGKTMAADKFDFGFAVDWMRKDLAICTAEARANGAALPVTALVDQFYARIQAQGGGRWDTSSLIRLLR
jgi:hypothetical protein